MQRAGGVVLATVLWSAGSALALAQAEADVGSPDLGVAIRVAPVSDVDMSAGRAILRGELVHSEFEFDGETDIGLGAELSYTHPILPYFALGGRLTGHTFEWDFQPTTRRDIIGSLSIVPRARLQLSAAAELYAYLALGVAVLWTGPFDQDMSGAPDHSRSTELGLGWQLAPMLGGRFATDHGYGFFVEAGAAIHRFSHEVDVVADGRGTTVPNTTETSIVQLVFTLGVFFDVDTHVH